MKEGDYVVVIKEKGRGHPEGTICKVLTVYEDEVYCQNIEGRTTYWYEKGEVKQYECSQ